MRRIAPLTIAAVLLALGGVAGAAPRIPAPRAPQNPHLAAGPNGNLHDDTWMTDAYARPGPVGRDLRTAVAPYAPSLCGSLTFDRHGHVISVCPSSVSAPVLRVFDLATLTVLAEHALPQAPSSPGTAGFQDFTGAGYFFLDERDRVWVATKTRHLLVLRISPDGRTVTQTRDFDLTSTVAGDERITSALPDFTGRIWFVSKTHGKVGVLDPTTGRIRIRRTGEEIENSFAVGRDAVYIVSDERMYRFSAGRDGRPRVDWKVRYRNAGIVKPGQVDAGSGTTPTLLPGGLVAITDNADPMDVVVYRTAKRLRRGQERLVCSVPVFERGGSATENSLIGAGRSLIVENNYGYQDPFGPGAGTLTRPGFARVDVRPGGRGCTRVWTTTELASPSVVPKLSTATQLVYTYVQTAGGRFSWAALSARTGRTVFVAPAGEGLFANNNYAGIALGPDGAAYLGTIGGLRRLSDGA